MFPKISGSDITLRKDKDKKEPEDEESESDSDATTPEEAEYQAKETPQSKIETPRERGTRDSETLSEYPYTDGFTCGPRIRMRYVIVALLFFSTMVAYATRVVISVTIVAMLNNSINPEFREFHWDKEGREGVVLSSFFWGYCIAMLPSGVFVQMCGSRWPMFFSIFISSICVGLTPASAYHGGWLATTIIRTFQGAGQAAIFPALQAIIAVWTPLEERGRMATTIMCGSQIGLILTFPIAGLLIPSPGGWPSVYYVFGGLGLIWCIVWYFLGSSSPSLHPFISREERAFIEASIANEFTMKMTTPWKEILTCPSVWALLACHCSQNFGFWSLLAEMPTYMDKVYNFKIEENGFLSALPYLVMALLSLAFGSMADLLYKRQIVSVDVSRKIFNSIGLWIPSFTLIALGFISKEEETTAVVLMVIAVGFNAGSITGFSLGHVDLAPNFSGILMGITNFAANIFSIFGTLMAAFLIEDNKADPKNWQYVFTINGVLLFIGNLIYVIVFKAVRQPWNDPNYKPEKKARKTFKSESDVFD